MKYLLFLLVLSCASHHEKPAAFNWKEASKKLTHDYAVSTAPLAPEIISEMGYNQFEHFTTPYSKDYQKERYAHAYQWRSRLERLIEEEKNVEYKTDIKILLDQVSLEMEGIELAREQGIIPFLGITETIYFNMHRLLPKDATKKMRNNALSRFRYYVHGDEEQLPIVDGYMAHMIQQMKHLEENRKRGFWPTKDEIETYLKDSDGYIEAIGELLSQWKEDMWKNDLETLKTQDKLYREFLKRKVLPYARKTNLTPAPIYAFTLKEMDINTSPEKLIDIAKKDYRATYLVFSELAHEIAKEKGLAKNDPLSVIQYLTSKKLTDERELLKLYEKTNEELFQIIVKNNILTIKERPNLVIRIANPSEMKSLPAPHFNNAPFFGKQKDRPAEFVVTSPEGGRDDFSYPEAVTTLTAHESMPGHALQYHMMRERGTTLMRSWFAFNSVNVEGWGLYAEDLVYPYLNKETQFVSLQRRLWRQARMFLDPELNLGKINGQRVLDVFMKELGFSKPFAESELRRYSYIMPGQANSYYYGYKKLMGMKARMKNDRCFNDTVLNYGILPLDEISARLEKVSCAAHVKK